MSRRYQVPQKPKKDTCASTEMQRKIMTNIYESHCSEGVRILMVENIEYSFQTEAEMLCLVLYELFFFFWGGVCMYFGSHVYYILVCCSNLFIA